MNGINEKKQAFNDILLRRSYVDQSICWTNQSVASAKGWDHHTIQIYRLSRVRKKNLISELKFTWLQNTKDEKSTFLQMVWFRSRSVLRPGNMLENDFEALWKFRKIFIADSTQSCIATFDRCDGRKSRLFCKWSDFALGLFYGPEICWRMILRHFENFENFHRRLHPVMYSYHLWLMRRTKNQLFFANGLISL